MTIVVGIDGSFGWVRDPNRRASYDTAFVNSFVRLITRHGGPRAYYERGPSTLGIGLVASVERATLHSLAQHRAAPQEPIVLTGYSRGGAGAIVVARNLWRFDIRVEAVMLFDAVDRHALFDAYEVPPNVDHVLHVMRSAAGKTRESFSNAGTRQHWRGTGSDYDEAFYRCTHGGMGGTPFKLEEGQRPTDRIDEGTSPYLATTRYQTRAGWRTGHRLASDGMTDVTFEQDRQIAGRVWHDVWPFLRAHDFIQPGTPRTWPGPAP